jgi:MoaA/NifB/PqqE/SkfB family radical SAM enzyme
MEKDFFSQIDYLMLETNSSCNLACAFCNRKDLEAQGLRHSKNITEEELHFILDKLRPTKINAIKLEGLSEPMLHPRFDILSGILRSYFPKAFVIIATNLQYSLPATPFLKTLPFVDMVYLSIDGTGAIYEQARPGAQFKKLLRSLDDIKKLVPLEIRRSKLHINFTLSPQNYHELPRMYELKDDVGLASVRINLAQNWSEHEKNPLEFGQEIIEFLKPYAKDVKGVPQWDYKDCFWPFNGIIIDVFGEIRQCVVNTSMKPLGNIFRDDVRALYNSSGHFTKAREMLSKNCPPSNCVNCDYKHLTGPLSEILKNQATQIQPRPKAFT